MGPGFRARRGFIAAASSTLGIAVFGPLRARAAETFTLRLSSIGNAETVWNTMAARLADTVARRSKGRLKIELFPNSVLAKERPSIDGLVTGAVDLAIQSGVFLESIVPQMQVLTLPFLFKDSTSAYRVMDGPIGAEFTAELAKRGILTLAWGSTGFRQLETTGKIVRVPEDMKGLRLRIQGGVTYVGMAQALGAIPVAIDISEVYTALSQRTIDAIDSTPDGLIDNKFYNIVTRVARTNHVFNLQPLVGSKQKIEAMPADLQKILRDEARAIIPYWRAFSERHGTDSITALKAKGLAFNDVDYGPFRSAMDPVYAAAQTRLGGDIVQRVSRAAIA